MKDLVIIVLILACIVALGILCWGLPEITQHSAVLLTKPHLVCGFLKPSAFAPSDSSKDVFMRVPCL